MWSRISSIIFASWIISISQAFLPLLHQQSLSSPALSLKKTSIQSPLSSSFTIRSSSLCSRRRSSSTSLDALLGGPEIQVAVDLTKVMSDDIYGPMFFQAMLLSVSGVIAAAALAAVIAFRGDSFAAEILEEAYQERDKLREKLGTEEDADGTIIIGFNKKQLPPPPKPVQEEAPIAAESSKVEKPKELVSAINDFED